MKIYIDKNDLAENLYSFLRKCGYAPFRGSYVRPLSSGSYPRFHIYVQETKKQYILNLHIDQKRPSYGKETAHSGEYEGGVAEKEAERIKELGVKNYGNKNGIAKICESKYIKRDL